MTAYHALSLSEMLNKLNDDSILIRQSHSCFELTEQQIIEICDKLLFKPIRLAILGWNTQNYYYEQLKPMQLQPMMTDLSNEATSSEAFKIDPDRDYWMINEGQRVLKALNIAFHGKIIADSYRKQLNNADNLQWVKNTKHLYLNVTDRSLQAKARLLGDKEVPSWVFLDDADTQQAEIVTMKLNPANDFDYIWFRVSAIANYQDVEKFVELIRKIKTISGTTDLFYNRGMERLREIYFENKIVYCFISDTDEISSIQ